MGHHTVREALEFSAHIRLPASIAKPQRDAWVNEVMALVGLTNIAATPGLAPGQLKLVTIAVELVANPSVLFLDEPTSGLDAPSAFRIMTAVKRISHTGRSVLCTIHQPSSELFFMFDRLLLLRSGGEEVFFSDIGPHGKLLVDYFEHRSEHVVKHPPRLPTGQNPANWMLDVIGSGVHSDEGGAIAALDYEAADWHQLWKTSELQKQVYAELAQVSAPENAGVDAAEIAINQPYHGWLTRYYLVQQRYFVMHWRNAPINLSRCILMLAVGILFGLIYRDVTKDTYAGVQAFLAVIFLGLGFPAAIASASALPSLFRQRAVYYRESTINMYDYWTYSTAIAVVEAPYIFFIVPFYFLVGFANSGTLFFKYYLVLFIQALVFSFMSHIWLALMPSQISSNIINGLFLSLFFVFGGVFIKPANIRTGWKWFYYLDPLAKSLIAGAMPQFYCDVDEPNNQCPRITVSNVDGTTDPYAYEYVVGQLEGANSTYWPMIGYLLIVSRQLTPAPDACSSCALLQSLTLHFCCCFSGPVDSRCFQNPSAAGTPLRLTHQELS
jgi:energy-coupling factor transporter ATP-binding protein EcfA2